MTALKDPLRANLDRIQIVKGWLDAAGETHEHVYNVEWSDKLHRKADADGNIDPVGNTVNSDTAQWTDTIGATELA